MSSSLYPQAIVQSALHMRPQHRRRSPRPEVRGQIKDMCCRVEHSHQSRSFEILLYDWLNLTTYADVKVYAVIIRQGKCVFELCLYGTRKLVQQDHYRPITANIGQSWTNESSGNIYLHPGLSHLHQAPTQARMVAALLLIIIEY